MSAKFLYFFSIQNEYLVLTLCIYLLYLTYYFNAILFCKKKFFPLLLRALSLIQYWHGRPSSGFQGCTPTFSRNYTYKSTNFSAQPQHYIYTCTFAIYSGLAPVSIGKAANEGKIAILCFYIQNDSVLWYSMAYKMDS